VYTAEKTKTDLADKLDAGMVERLNSAITAVKAALDGKDIAQIKAETEKLQKALGEAGTAAYQHVSQQAQQQAGGPQEAPPGGSAGTTTGPNGEHVVDADFKVKDDNS
ncbi:MAG: molecular chaperone DnaK, partial [Methanoregula sp.]